MNAPFSGMAPLSLPTKLFEHNLTMSSPSSFTAEPGKRLWAGGFDFLAVCVMFLVLGVILENIYPTFSGWLVFAFTFFVYHLACLAVRDGRTLGKTAIDICVISTSGQPLSTGQSVLRAGVRTIPFLFLGASDPFVVLFGAALLLVLMLSEFYLLERSPNRQTLTDRIANSLVVKMPPLQPHRAPAGPMYSASDLEFGFPPKRRKNNPDG